MSQHYLYSDNLHRPIRKKVTTTTTARDADGKIVSSQEVTVLEEYTYPTPVNPIGTRYADGGKLYGQD